MKIYYYLLLLAAILTNVSAQLFLKRGALLLNELQSSVSDKILYALKSHYIWLGLSCYGVSFVIFIIVLTKINLTSVYPLNFGLGFTLIAVASHFLFYEFLSPINILGAVLIFCGLLLIVR